MSFMLSCAISSIHNFQIKISKNVKLQTKIGVICFNIHPKIIDWSKIISIMRISMNFPIVWKFYPFSALFFAVFKISMFLCLLRYLQPNKTLWSAFKCFELTFIALLFRPRQNTWNRSVTPNKKHENIRRQ